MKDFKKLIIWDKGMEIVKNTYQISKQLPIEEKFSIISQMNRAALSIPLNIAEGSSRKSNKDYARFLEYSLGSTFELETLILLINNLNMLKLSDTEILLNKVIEEQKMLQSFISTVKT